MSATRPAVRPSAGKSCFQRGAQTTATPGPPARTSVTEHIQHMAASATARAIAPAPLQDHFKGENFAALLDETLGRDTGFDGSVVTGRVRPPHR